MDLRHRQTLYSGLFLAGPVVFVCLYVYFPPRSLGVVGAAFILVPLWVSALVGSLVLTWREAGWSRGFPTYAITSLVLLALTFSMYSGGADRQPFREIRTAMSAWQRPGTVTYEDLYANSILEDREWMEPRRAAALLKFRDSIPEAGCAVGYRPVDTARASSQALRKVYYIEWRDGSFATSDSSTRLETITADTVRIQDRFQNEEVVVEVQLNYLMTTPKQAGPHLTVRPIKAPEGMNVEMGCPKMWPDTVFSRRFYYFLQRRGWPE